MQQPVALDRLLRQRADVRQSTWVRPLLTVLLLASLAMMALPWRWFDLVSPQDEALLLVYPDLILRGYTAYVDFAAAYPPGNFYLLAAAFHIFGENLFVERFVGIGYQFLMALAICFLGWRVAWISGFLAAGAVIAVLHFFPAAGAYSMFGSLAVLLWAWLCVQRCYDAVSEVDRNRWAVLSGVLAGGTFWFRQDIGVIGTLALLVTLYPLKARGAAFFFAGLALPASAMLVFAALTGPSVMFDSLVLDVLRAGPGRQLPLQISPWLVALIACVAFNLAIALLVRADKTGAQRAWLARGIAVLSMGLLPAVLQRADLWHITYVGAVVAGLAVVSASIFFIHMNWQRVLAAKGAIAIVPVVLGGFAYWFVPNTNWERAETPRIAAGKRWIFAHNGIFANDADSLAAAKNLLEDIDRNARPGETLFVGPRDLRFTNYNDTFFYYLLPRLRPASRYLEMSPGVANRPDSGLDRQIATADWLILTSRYDGWSEPNTSVIPGSAAPNEVIGRSFCIQSERGPWQLLRRCG